MPLNRPALSLGSGPRGVREARRWVVAACHEIGRGDLVECAELGVSELVTNALLHGEGPIEVRVRGTLEHPRVEVRESSTEPPVLPNAVDMHAGGEEDGLLLTFGRGLRIVARASEAWGAEIEDDGKVVWFAPSREFSEDDGPEGQITGVNRVVEGTGEHPTDVMEFKLAGVPVKDYLAFQRHFRELRREVRLLALAHEADYPLAKDLSDIFGRLGRPLRLDQASPEIAAAQVADAAITDLHLVMSRTTARGVDRFLELLELTDAFCREEKMLALARSRDQHAFQTWFLGELVRQAVGKTARSYTGVDSAPAGSQRTSVS